MLPLLSENPSFAYADLGKGFTALHFISMWGPDCPDTAAAIQMLLALERVDAIARCGPEHDLATPLDFACGMLKIYNTKALLQSKAVAASDFSSIIQEISANEPCNGDHEFCNCANKDMILSTRAA